MSRMQGKDSADNTTAYAGIDVCKVWLDTVPGERHYQGKYRGTFPYLVVDRDRGPVVSMTVVKNHMLKPGDEVCLLLMRGWLLDRRSARLAEEAKCRN